MMSDDKLCRYCETRAEGVATVEVCYEHERPDIRARAERRIRQLADKDAQIAALKAALLEACEIANEGWEYAGDYFRDKWLPPNRIDEFRKLAEGT